MLTLGIFGFKALWSPYFFIFLLSVITAYFLITIKFRSKFTESEPLTRKQGAYFTIAIFFLYAIKGSPLDIMAHLLFYVHMIQMAVLVLFIPPLFILGIPVWIWKKAFQVKMIHSIFLFFTQPLIALLVFNGLFSFYHVPFIFDHVMQNGWLHAGYSILLFMVAMFMWWPLLNELPEHQTLTGIKKVGYIFADGILLTPACALIMFANNPLYLTYSDPHVWAKAMSLCVGSNTFSGLNISSPQLFSSMPVVLDQQLGGVIMKVIQEVVYGVMLGRVFFGWYKNDQAEAERDLKANLNRTIIE